MLLGCNKKDDADDILSIRPYEKKKLADRFFPKGSKGSASPEICNAYQILVCFPTWFLIVNSSICSA